MAPNSKVPGGNLDSMQEGDTNAITVAPAASPTINNAPAAATTQNQQDTQSQSSTQVQVQQRMDNNMFSSLSQSGQAGASSAQPSQGQGGRPTQPLKRKRGRPRKDEEQPPHTESGVSKRYQKPRHGGGKFRPGEAPWSQTQGPATQLLSAQGSDAEGALGSAPWQPLHELAFNLDDLSGGLDVDLNEYLRIDLDDTLDRMREQHGWSEREAGENLNAMLRMDNHRAGPRLGPAPEQGVFGEGMDLDMSRQEDAEGQVSSGNRQLATGGGEMQEDTEVSAQWPNGLRTETNGEGSSSSNVRRPNLGAYAPIPHPTPLLGRGEWNTSNQDGNAEPAIQDGSRLSRNSIPSTSQNLLLPTSGSNAPLLPSGPTQADDLTDADLDPVFRAFVNYLGETGSPTPFSLELANGADINFSPGESAGPVLPVLDDERNGSPITRSRQQATPWVTLSLPSTPARTQVPRARQRILRPATSQESSAPAPSLANSTHDFPTGVPSFSTIPGPDILMTDGSSSSMMPSPRTSAPSRTNGLPLVNGHLPSNITPAVLQEWYQNGLSNTNQILVHPSPQASVNGHQYFHQNGQQTSLQRSSQPAVMVYQPSSQPIPHEYVRAHENPPATGIPSGGYASPSLPQANQYVQQNGYTNGVNGPNFAPPNVLPRAPQVYLPPNGNGDHHFVSHSARIVQPGPMTNGYSRMSSTPYHPNAPHGGYAAPQQGPLAIPPNAYATSPVSNETGGPLFSPAVVASSGLPSPAPWPASPGLGLGNGVHDLTSTYGLPLSSMPQIGGQTVQLYGGGAQAWGPSPSHRQNTYSGPVVNGGGVTAQPYHQQAGPQTPYQMYKAGRMKASPRQNDQTRTNNQLK